MKTTFDRDHWIDRLQAGTRNNPGGNGYIAVVHDRGPAGDRFRRPNEVYSSHIKHGGSGVFKTHLKALRHAEQWADGRIAQLQREHELRVARGLELSSRLRELGLALGQLERDKKVIGNRIKANEDEQRALIDEANDPEVVLDLRPSSDRWRLYDAPCVTDGTKERDAKQLVLEGTGVDGPELAEEGPPDDGPAPPPPTAMHPIQGGKDSGDGKTPEEPAKGRKLPVSVQGGNGKRCKPGDYVEGPGGEGWLVAIDRFLKGGAFGVIVVDAETGTPSHCANHQIRKIRKPRGQKAPPWPPEESAAAGPGDDDSADAVPEHERLPADTTDRDGKAIDVGSYVKVLGRDGEPGYEGEIVGYLVVDGETCLQVDPGDGTEAGEAWPGEVLAIQRPAAGEIEADTDPGLEPKPPGLDPSAVQWPEDDDPPEVEV